MATEAATEHIREPLGERWSSAHSGRPDACDAPSDVALLTISRIDKRYGPRAALADVSAALGPGLTGLLGPNGAGKSTLLRCLAGIQTWDAGDIRVLDQPLDKTGRRQVGYMPETTAFPPELKVEALLRFACAAKGITRDWRTEVTQKALATGIVDVRNRIIGTLSKGYRQRIALAQAMLGDPPILLLDEPVASLDPISVVEIREAIRAYGQSACVLVSTHQLAEARALCDRVLILDHGRLVFDGPLLAMGGDCDRDVEIRVGGVEVVVAEAIVNELRPVVSPTFVARPGEDLVVRVRGANRADIATLVRRFVSVGGDVSGVESIGDALENAFASAVSGSAQVSP